MQHTFRIAPAGDDTSIPYMRRGTGHAGRPHLLWPGHWSPQFQEGDIMFLSVEVVLWVRVDLSHSPDLQTLLIALVNAGVNAEGGGCGSAITGKI